MNTGQPSRNQNYDPLCSLRCGSLLWTLHASRQCPRRAVRRQSAVGISYPKLGKRQRSAADPLFASLLSLPPLAEAAHLGQVAAVLHIAPLPAAVTADVHEDPAALRAAAASSGRPSPARNNRRASVPISRPTRRPHVTRSA